MFKYLHQIWTTKAIRDKILFSCFGLLVYRLVSHVSVPGVDHEALAQVFDSNALLGVFALFTGGSLESFSLVLMGLAPYINASIILQLMTVVIPKLERLSKEGEAGRRTINRWTRYLTIPLAILQSYGMVFLLNSSAAQIGTQIVSDVTNPAIILPIMISITAGTVFLMWLGELVTEKGIGNGISLIIFAGIVAAVPGVVGQTLGLATFDSSRYFPFILLAIITVLLLVLTVAVNEGYRNIPITYAGHQSGRGSDKSGLPIRVNQAGMIPIIFAISLITFPGLVAQFYRGNPVADWFIVNFAGSGDLSYIYIAILFLLVLGFGYFYVSITFNPVTVAENIQKRGGFVPGIRPGTQTSEHIGAVSDRMNLWGGLFVAFLAAGPLLLQRVFVELNLGTVQLLMSGSGLIIVVGVVVEIHRNINVQLTQHNYDKYY
jgi:preprotein translocase subunit SecY